MATNILFDERKLLARVAKGDQRAFRSVYDHYYDRIYGYALRLLKSVPLAEEAVQSAFLKIWTLGDKLTAIENLESYLVTMTRNLALDALRQQKLSANLSQEVGLRWSEVHNETEEEILLNDTRRVLDDAVDRLPAQQKRVYELCRLQGLKYEEAAKTLNLSPATVHSYMKIALGAIRRHMAARTDILLPLFVFALA